MKSIWGRPLSTVVLIIIAALFSWPILGGSGALLVLSALLLVLLFHHLFNLSALYRWLRNARPENAPVGSGSWEYVFSHLLRMLKRHQQSEVRLSEALSRFQLAGAALPDAVVILDEGDRIEWCNPKAEDYFGLDNERDRGQQITYILRQPQFVKHLASGQVGESLVLPISREQGEMVLSVQLVPFGDRQKLLLGRDITRWERLETTRRDFVANVSHELRTPLTVVGGFLETLSEMKKPDAEMTQRSILLMSQQTGRMSRLVDDLLTLSRLESTHNPLREEDVNIPDLVKALHQDAAALSAGRHKLRVSLESNDWLKGNTEELRSAFGNLIGNAVSYTPEKGEVEIRWENRQGHPVFAVRDTGIGIEPQHIDRLTERFYRVDRSRSRETGGTGLGLAIVKHVLNRHQAKLEVQSSLGSGSTFAFIFPESRRLPAKEPAAAEVQEPAISR